MSMSFRELAGSPVEEYGPQGFRARREFLVAWEDRAAFAAAALGAASGYGGGLAASYPGRSAVRAVSLKFEPFEPRPDEKPLASLTADMNSYSGAPLRAVIEYRSLVPPRLPRVPPVPPETFLGYRMQFAAEHVPLAPRGWQWIDDPELPLPDDLNLTLIVPLTEHHVTWHRVPLPPWEAIRALQGRVNDDDFLGAAAGTVRFDGAEADKDFQTVFDAAHPEWFWKLRYVFRERTLHVDDVPVTWNHVYREDPPGWAGLAAGARPLYLEGDFGRLFEFGN